jgi:2-dehydropantoate 2-reductase
MPLLGFRLRLIAAHLSSISTSMQSRQPIHILGIGNLGKLVAHSLRKSHPDTPITLLFHRPSLIEEWNKAGQCIEVVRNGVPDRQSDFSYEVVSKEQSTIRNLVVATKAYATVQALKPLRDRLAPLSTLLFLQNGIGTCNTCPVSTTQC